MINQYDKEDVFEVLRTFEVFEFLDDLRESGATNMWGAGAYVKSEFECTKKEAQTLVLGWMNTFEKGNMNERVADYLINVVRPV